MASRKHGFLTAVTKTGSQRDEWLIFGAQNYPRVTVSIERAIVHRSAQIPFNGTVRPG
jgi:hypothetical protein